MNDDDLGPWESQLRQHLSRHLDGQLGRSLKRFEAEPPAARHNEPPERSRPPAPRVTLRTVLAGVAALAAAVMLLALLVSDGEEQAEAPRPQVDQRADIDRIENDQPTQQDQHPRPDVPRDPAAEATITADLPPGGPDAALDANESSGASNALANLGQPLIIERLLRSRTLDEGTVLIDGRTPARKLRRQWYERVEWYDRARGARMERIVPREEVVFVRIPTL
ncbi:MAG: hypothetical protein WD847_15630 [Pirellulales bacterium]